MSLDMPRVYLKKLIIEFPGFFKILVVPIFQCNLEKNINIISAPQREFYQSDTLSTNVLALAPGECLMLNNLPETEKVLRNEKLKVTTFQAPSLCIGCEGGPTCLTRPILRM